MSTSLLQGFAARLFSTRYLPRKFDTGIYKMHLCHYCRQHKTHTKTASAQQAWEVSHTVFTAGGNLSPNTKISHLQLGEKKVQVRGSTQELAGGMLKATQFKKTCEQQTVLSGYQFIPQTPSFGGGCSFHTALTVAVRPPSSSENQNKSFLKCKQSPTGWALSVQHSTMHHTLFEYALRQQRTDYPYYFFKISCQQEIGQLEHGRHLPPGQGVGLILVSSPGKALGNRTGLFLRG